MATVVKVDNKTTHKSLDAKQGANESYLVQCAVSEVVPHCFHQIAPSHILITTELIKQLPDTILLEVFAQECFLMTANIVGSAINPKRIQHNKTYLIQ
jgi:hypothetical protein